MTAVSPPHREPRGWLQSGRWTALAIAAAAALESVGWRGAPWTHWNAWIWLAAGAGVLLASLYMFFRALWRDVRSRRLWGWPVLALVSFTTLWGVKGVDLLGGDHEAAQEVCAGLANLARADFGLQERAFLSYPARQYLIPALPSLVAGRSFAALRLGFALPFLLGVGVFYAGLRAWLGGRQAAAAAAALALPWCFTHWPGLARCFEQSVLPPTLGLFAAGWAMLLARRVVHPTAGAAVLAWLGGAAAMGYTPGLALAGLVAAAAAAAAWRWRSDSDRLALAFATLIYVGLLIALAIGLTGRGRFFPGVEAESALRRLADAAAAVATGQPFAFVAPVVLPAMLAALGFALAARLGAAARWIALWVVGSVAAAAWMPGYVWRPIAFDLQRAGVAIPVLVWLMVEGARRGAAFARARGLGRFLPSAPSLAAATVALAGWSMTAGPLPNTPRAAGQRHDYLLLDLATALEGRGLGVNAAFEVRVPEDISGGNLGEQLAYFYPRARLDFSSWPADAAPPLDRVVLCYADPPRTASLPGDGPLARVENERGETVLFRVVVEPAPQPDARSN